MHKLLLIGLFLSGGISLKAQYTGYTPLTDLSKFKELFPWKRESDQHQK